MLKVLEHQHLPPEIKVPPSLITGYNDDYPIVGHTECFLDVGYAFRIIIYEETEYKTIIVSSNYSTVLEKIYSSLIRKRIYDFLIKMTLSK